MMKNSFIVSKSERLDKFLATKFPSFSRAYLKEQIKLGNILIGGKIAKPSCKLREGDLVAFAPEFTLPSAPQQILSNPAIKLKIIYEDKDVLVIDKPAGLAVHPRQDKNGAPLASEVSSTLVSGLLAYYPKIKNVGDSPLLRPGLVHRLDKDTSGVMMIAKNQTSFDWLKSQFKERRAKKKYLALAQGVFKEKQGEIKTLLARSKSDPTKQKVEPWTQNTTVSLSPKNSQIQVQGETPHRRPNAIGNEKWPSGARGKEAITRYKVIKEFKNYTLLEASPKTGRLHQIRVHLAWLGHSVAGDKKYGAKNQLLPHGLTRQFLHATELKITLPNGQNMTFYAPLPVELQTILAVLENK